MQVVLFCAVECHHYGFSPGLESLIAPYFEYRLECDTHYTCKLLVIAGVNPLGVRMVAELTVAPVPWASFAWEGWPMT